MFLILNGLIKNYFIINIYGQIVFSNSEMKSDIQISDEELKLAEEIEIDSAKIKRKSLIAYKLKCL